MNNLKEYISEKFKISKDIKMSRDDIVDYIKTIIYDTLKDFNLNEDDCRIGLCKDKNLIAYNADEAIAIRLSLKKENRMNKKLHLDIVNKLRSVLSDYKVSLEKNTIDDKVYKIQIYF